MKYTPPGAEALVKIAPGLAAGPAAAANLSAAALPLAVGTDTRRFAVALHDARLWYDLVRYLGAVLPRQEGLWWGCLCVWRLTPPTGEDRTAFAEAVRWVAAPGEQTRAAATNAATAASPDRSPHWLAQTAAIDNAPSTPGSDRGAAFVGGSILLAAADADPVRSPEPERHCAVLGLQIASGRYPCPQPRALSRGTSAR